jgi:hypothetical protein
MCHAVRHLYSFVIIKTDTVLAGRCGFDCSCMLKSELLEIALEGSRGLVLCM